LLKAIRASHGVEATWIESVPIVETFRGQVAWDGTVHVFAVDHPKTKRVFAWSFFPDDASERRRVTAVLGVAPLDDPRRAVQAAIVAEARQRVGH
jgi:hypothetical protein